MAGNNQRDTVAGHAVTDGPGRSGKARLGRQLGVAKRMAVRDATALLEHATLETGQLAGVDADVAQRVGLSGGERLETPHHP